MNDNNFFFIIGGKWNHGMFDAVHMLVRSFIQNPVIYFREKQLWIFWWSKILIYSLWSVPLLNFIRFFLSTSAEAIFQFGIRLHTKCYVHFCCVYISGSHTKTCISRKWFPCFEPIKQFYIWINPVLWII